MRKSRHSAHSRPLIGISDRGPAKYFHGRKKILRDFHELVEDTVKTKTGTIFLIQGAPGAGKSALLAECEKMVGGQGWETAEIDPPALWYPDELLHYLGRGSSLSFTGGSGQVGVNALVKADAKFDIEVNQPRRTTRKILQDGKKPLLLILDEAQTLGTTNAPPSDQSGTATNVLNAIHNGKLNRPVILIAAGLGSTEGAFESLGISRFRRKCLIDLGALSKEAERAVIHDWLKKEGRAKGDPTKWMDTISQETHGWPQHILSYVIPALEQLDVDKGIMTLDGLNAMLEVGRESRLAYYEHRSSEFSRRQRHSLAKLIANIPLEEGLDKEDILLSLTQEYGEATAEKLFDRALHKGILYKRSGVYAVPIPSMQNWLVTNYAHIQIKSPSQVQETRRHEGKSLGRNLER